MRKGNGERCNGWNSDLWEDDVSSPLFPPSSGMSRLRDEWLDLANAAYKLAGVPPHLGVGAFIEELADRTGSWVNVTHALSTTATRWMIEWHWKGWIPGTEVFILFSTSCVVCMAPEMALQQAARLADLTPDTWTRLRAVIENPKRW